MPQKRVTNPLQSPKPVPTGPPLVAPFPGTTGSYHSIPLIWTLSLQSLSKVSPRTDSDPLSISGKDHSSWEPHPKLRKTLGPKTILHSRHQIVAPIQQEVAREIRCPFPHFFFIFFLWFQRLEWRRLLGLEKKTTVSKALAESSNFGENKTEL